jgi:hypothetical protein
MLPDPSWRDYADRIFPDLVITAVFVLLPLFLLGGVLGKLDLAIFVSLPGLVTEILAAIVLVAKVRQ